MGWTVAFGVYLMIFLLVDLVNGQSALMPISGSGSGIDPPSCNSHSLSVTVGLFDSIADAFNGLDCTVPDEGYEVVYSSSELGLKLSESEKTVVFADYLESSVNAQTFTLVVCTYDIMEITYDSCSEEAVNVSVIVSKYDDRLLPFVGSFADGKLADVDDGAVSLVLTNRIPFWESYYSSIHLSTNGVISFGRRFTQYWPQEFPYGWSNIPLIAPYWTDLDFHNIITDSALYYSTYESSGGMRDEAFLEEFSERISSYTDGDTFNPTWMVVATWYKVTPSSGRSNTNETLTFQVLLATDSVDTYTMFLYEEGGINWNSDSQYIVIGYDAKDYVNYLNVEGSEDFTIIDEVTGNSGNAGEWYFRLTNSDPDDLTSEQECNKWAARQEKDIFETYFEGLPACPCTRFQARRDWGFWFGWRWGLSTAENCATLVWSRRQSTIECCYDENNGALLVEGKSGGSYKLYHPWFSNQKNVREERRAFTHCCQSSDLCSLFYTHRPSDDCSAYDPSVISFMRGDPHFQTVDGLNLTFNGIGEYVLLESDVNGLSIQVRLSPVGGSSDGTINSAVVVVQGDVQAVQVDHQPGDDILLHVAGEAVDSPIDDETLIITDTTVYDSFSEFTTAGLNASSTDFISLRVEDENLIISTSSGASVMVSNSPFALNLAVEVNSGFSGNTKGLLGNFNGDPSDDFCQPDGTIVSPDSSEMDLFVYGKLWHVSETESEFVYFDDNTYSTYNDGWNTHTPTFTDDLDPDVLADVEEVCHGSIQCIFDYAVTNNASFATATFETIVENQETQNILNNMPPVINGTMIIHVTSGQSIEETYSVSDEDGHDITSFELLESTDLTLELTGDSAVLVWDSPGYDLPQTPILLLANDSLGATTLHPISIVLCACQNNGTCVDTNTPLFNTNGHFRLECLCPELYSGVVCEVDERGCSEGSCPGSSVCVNDSSIEAGFNCSTCSHGYQLAQDGKCTDIDECDGDFEDGCMHTCNNTVGSYECQCDSGYRLAEDGRNCTDIDECYEGMDDCHDEQMCYNTNGTFECECYFPLVPRSDRIGCTADATCGGCVGTDGCAGIFEMDSGYCYCVTLGKYCVGDCNGTEAERPSGIRSCEDCMPNRYGYMCLKVCDCSEHGDCDAATGCDCHDGYTGHRCESELNEAEPKFLNETVKELRLSWNLPQGAVLAEFEARDTDVGRPGEVVYSLYHGHQLPSVISSGEGIFSITNETGILSLVEDLNTTRSTFNRFALSIIASDLGENPRSSELIVAVKLEDTPAPIPSFSEGVYQVKILESTPANSTVLNFTCSEPEGATGAGNLTTNLTETSDSYLFSLEGDFTDLMLVLLEERDYESLTDTSIPHYTVEVACTNQYALTGSATIEIELVNENDNEFEFENGTYVVTVPENIPRNYHLLQVKAFDPDVPDGRIIYSATGTLSKFSILRNGTVYVAETVNREEEDTYQLYIEAKLIETDEITEAVVNISIADINENPPIFSNDLYTSDNLTTANVVGDIALVVAANDDDFDKNGSVVYSLEENLLFSIDNFTGEVFINNPNVVSNYGAYLLRVFATDEGSPPMNSSSRVDIYVAPIPDRIEFQSILSPLSVREDSHRGLEIVTITADVLDENDGIIVDSQTVGRVVYELLVTEGSENYHVGKYSGKLILLNNLDFETVRSYNLTIQASIPEYTIDSINSTTDIVIAVTDANDNAPVFTPPLYTAVIEEFTEIGRSILTVTATDADSGANAAIRYRLAQNTANVPFTVDTMSGSIEVSESLDTPVDYRFYVVAEDGGGTSQRSSEAVVFISVVRSLSVVPEFDRQQYIFSIDENSRPETQIGTVLAQVEGNRSISDYPHLKYRLRSPDPNMTDDVSAMFHVDEDLGNMSVLSALDAEQQALYIVYVEVHNGSQIYDNATVEIHVDDVNDHTPQFRQSLYTDVITTAQPQNSFLFSVSADDGDTAGSKNSLVSYSLSDSNTIGFGINHTTGDVYVINSTLIAGDYHLMAVATDSGDPPLTGTVLVFISVIPAGPQGILFEESEYSFNVSEDASPETLLGTITALDHNRMPFPEDSGDVRYRFSNSTPTDFVHLTVGELTGDVLVSSNLDRETQASYTLVVIAEHEGNQTGEVRMTVNVLDINDNPPIFTKDVYAELIFTNHSNSTAILQVSASDRDIGLNGSVMYYFNGGDSETDQFRITSNTGDIYSRTTFLPAGDYRLVVVATDSNPTMPETSTAVVSICVIHQEPVGPLQITTTSFDIEENSPAGSVIGTVQLTAGGTLIVPEHYEGNLQFSIGSEYFLINSNNGTITLVGLLDREDQASYSFDVTVTFSEYHLNIVQDIDINVVDVNDNGPIFNPLVYSTIIDDDYRDNDTISISEIIVTDDDSGSNAEIDLTLDQLNPFDVRVTQRYEGRLHGVIYVSNASLIEPLTTYIFNIIANDRGDPRETSSAAVHVQVEYAIPDMIYFPSNQYDFNYTENSAEETVIGTVNVLPDTPALENLVYSITGGSGMFRFHIDQYSGAISNHFPLDRKQEDEYTLTIEARLIHQMTSVSTNTSVRITVLDTNDNIPIFDRSSYSTAVFIDDIVTDDPLINVSATDRDSGVNAEISYSLSPNNFFTILSNGSIFARSTLIEVRTHTLTVEAIDMGDVSLTGSTVVLIDVRAAIPETITFTQPSYLFSISEYNISGTVVGTVELDPSFPAEFEQYRSFSSDSQDFVVVTQSGAVQSRRQFDYESDPTTIEFYVTCTLDLPHENPPVTLTTNALVRVNIVDENDNDPVFVNFPNSLSTYENVTQEELVATIEAEDADSGINGELMYSIVNDVLLRIESVSGDLYVLPGMDREQQAVHAVSVSVSDRGYPSNSVQSIITLTLLDINDNAPILLETVFAVEERLSGEVVFTLEYSDSDEGEFGRATFTRITSDSDSRFSVHSQSGAVSLTQPLDYETETSVELLVELVDNPLDPTDQNKPQYTVIVNVIDKPDNVPVFDGDIDLNLNIDPGITEGDLLIRVHATDADNDEITYTMETNANILQIGASSGDITFRNTTTLTPGIDYEVTITAMDDSQYQLSSTIQLTVRIDARALTFEQASYSTSLSEDPSTVDKLFAKLRIQELARSEDYTYDFGFTVVHPVDVGNTPFRSWNNPFAINLVVNEELDREAVLYYILEVTATRRLAGVDTSSIETVEVNLTVTLDDVNDNAPIIISPADPSYTVEENSPVNTVVTRVVAMDADAGENATLEYSIISPLTSPFAIDSNDGTILVQEQPDFELQETYTLTIKVEDQGLVRMSSNMTMLIQITNMNDRAPQFAAPAYFGELYTLAPANSNLKHVIFEITDPDGDLHKDTDFIFSITPDSTDTNAGDYRLSVSLQPPFHIIANTIPSNAQTGLLTFNVEVSDGVNKNQSVLYVGVFGPENLLTMTVSGKSRVEFLSEVDEILSSFSSQLAPIYSTVSYYYESIDESRTDTTVLIMEVYGWYGDYGTRLDNGKERTRQLSNSINYVTYDVANQDQLSEAAAGLATMFDLDITIGDIPQTTPSVDPTSAEPASDNTQLAGIVGGIVVAILILVLLIVLIAVIGRRRKPKEKKDPYDTSYDGRRRGLKRPESFAMTQKGGTSSDLAYETMYDEEDDLLNQTQSMPWFDPNYLASNQNDEYDGDGEQSSLKGGPLRATVDGDAKRPRRNSAEADERGSLLDLDRTKYLDSYQQSTPMAPGQRLGEYDMFVNRNAAEAEKPRRPSLDNLAGYNHHHQGHGVGGAGAGAPSAKANSRGVQKAALGGVGGGGIRRQ